MQANRGLKHKVFQEKIYKNLVDLLKHFDILPAQKWKQTTNYKILKPV